MVLQNSTQFVRDSFTMTRRSFQHIFRSVDSLITGLMLPIIITLLFVIVFGGAISTGTEYINYIVPAVILTCVGYGSSTTAMIVAQDMTTGLIDRFRSLPMARSTLLIGHVNGSLIRNAISALLTIGVAFLLGFRPDATFWEWLTVIALLIAIVLAFSWLSILFGLIVKSVDAAAAMAFIVMFLPYISSGFVPLHTLPDWLQGFATNQPMTPIIDSLRGLLIGTPTDSLGLAFLWSFIILIISYLAAMTVYRRRLVE